MLYKLPFVLSWLPWNMFLNSSPTEESAYMEAAAMKHVCTFSTLYPACWAILTMNTSSDWWAGWEHADLRMLELFFRSTAKIHNEPGHILTCICSLPGALLGGGESMECFVNNLCLACGRTMRFSWKRWSSYQLVVKLIFSDILLDRKLPEMIPDSNQTYSKMFSRLLLIG